LVARGFEEFNPDIPKYSPTCGTDSLRLILAALVQKDWKMHTMDIKTAFLQGVEISRKIFIRPPEEANQRQSVKIKDKLRTENVKGS